MILNKFQRRKKKSINYLIYAYVTSSNKMEPTNKQTKNEKKRKEKKKTEKHKLATYRLHTKFDDSL